MDNERHKYTHDVNTDWARRITEWNEHLITCLQCGISPKSKIFSIMWIFSSKIQGVFIITEVSVFTIYSQDSILTRLLILENYIWFNNLLNISSQIIFPTQYFCPTSVINRKLILTAPKLYLGKTDVPTFNQGLEEVDWWQHNVPDLCDKHFGQRKTNRQQDAPLKSALYFVDKRERCLCCHWMEECEKRSFHFVSLYSLTYFFQL